MLLQEYRSGIHRHYKKLSISKSRTREHLNREHLNIDETLRAGVYSAELFLPPVKRRAKARPLQRQAAVKTQGSIALTENAEPSQRASLFALIEITPMLGDHDSAGRQEIRGT